MLLNSIFHLDFRAIRKFIPIRFKLFLYLRQRHIPIIRENIYQSKERMLNIVLLIFFSLT